MKWVRFYKMTVYDYLTKELGITELGARSVLTHSYGFGREDGLFSQEEIDKANNTAYKNDIDSMCESINATIDRGEVQSPSRLDEKQLLVHLESVVNYAEIEREELLTR